MSAPSPLEVVREAVLASLQRQRDECHAAYVAEADGFAGGGFTPESVRTMNRLWDAIDDLDRAVREIEHLHPQQDPADTFARAMRLLNRLSDWSW